MRFNYIIKTLVIFCLFTDVTYAAGGSLWGNIDAPVQDVNLTPIAPQQPAAPQKTVCEILAQKADLGNDIINSSSMQDNLKGAANAAKPEYVMILSDPAAVRDLYKQFREQYLQTYCKK